MLRARLIVSAVLFTAFAVSVVFLFLDMSDTGNGDAKAPTIELPEIEAVTAAPQIPSTMIPRIPRVTSNMPSSILNLTDWKLTLPAGDDDEPLEISQPKLAFYREPRFFYVDPIGEGVVFRAPVGGVTTSGSDYPRSELREMTDGGKKEASWSAKSGTHVMTITEAITALPPNKPEVVAGQIHDEEDDIVMLRLSGKRLFVEADGDDVGTLDPAYELGTAFTTQFMATRGRIQVSYNGLKTVEIKRSGKNYYFKAGCYTQSNSDKDDDDAYGEVVIYSLLVQHAP